MKKICTECMTENEQHYLYCKNCGTELPINPVQNTVQAENQVPQGQINNPQVSGNVKSGWVPFNDKISDIEQREFIAFLGKNAHNIYEKFVKMEITGARYGWCWPVAVLTFFFGFMGSALWFFYRKMYKPAVILLIIGLVLAGVQNVLMLDQNVQAMQATFSSVGELFRDESASGSDDVLTALEGIEQAGEIISENTVGSLIAQVISYIECYGGAIFMGLYAFYVYKKHSIKKIKAYRESAQNEQYYLYGLSLIGGVSGGMLAVGIISLIVVENILSLIPLLFVVGG